MTDILLIQPPIRDFYLTRKRTIPYGLACIAGSLIKKGFTVSIFDSLATSKSRIVELPEEMQYLTTYFGVADTSPFSLFHHSRHFGYSFDHIGNVAKNSGAFLIGISSLFTAYSAEAIKTAEAIKKACPQCKIVLGGHHPTALPEPVMKCRSVDYVIRGEGEAGLPMLAQAIKHGKHLDSIPGIVFRKQGDTLHISPPAIMENPDTYPLPAIQLIKHAFYQRKKSGSSVIVASRGCPMKCSYCSVGASGPPYRKRSVLSVIKEMEIAITQYHVRFIDFEDENLSLDRQWFLALLHEIQSRFSGIGLELRAMNGLFPPSLDQEIVKEMKAAGFKTLNLSLGSINSAQLKRFARPNVTQSVETAIHYAKKNDLEVVCYIIVGSPSQYAADSLQDLLYLTKKKVLAGLSVFYPAPGSPDYKRCAKDNLLPDQFSLMRSTALPISHTTSRIETVTLLRLGRIYNFIKSITDQGMPLPEPSSDIVNNMSYCNERQKRGRKLLSWFLNDGRIRGITSEGNIYEHTVSLDLTRRFISGYLRA